MFKIAKKLDMMQSLISSMLPSEHPKKSDLSMKPGILIMDTQKKMFIRLNTVLGCLP